MSDGTPRCPECNLPLLRPDFWYCPKCDHTYLSGDLAEAGAL